MSLTIGSRLSFKLSFKNEEVKVLADAIIIQRGKEYRYEGSYLVQIFDKNNTQNLLLYKINNNTGEFESGFAHNLHPDIIRKIGYEITNQTA